MRGKAHGTSQPSGPKALRFDESDQPYNFRVSVTSVGPRYVIVRGYGQLTKQTLPLLECVVATPRADDATHTYVDLHEATIADDVMDDLLRLGRSAEATGTSMTIIGAALRFGSLQDPLAPTG